MNERNKARLLPLACLALALAAPQLVEAQFGGLGRRITEGAKKAAGVEPDDAAKPETSKPVVAPHGRSLRDPDHGHGAQGV